MKLSAPLRVANARVTSGYGPRKSFEVSPGVWTIPFHYGDDWAAPAGTPIYSSSSGVVTRVGFDNDPDYEAQGIVRWPGLAKGVIYGGGWWVFVRTGDIEIRYMHMQKKPSVKVGQKVTTSTVLGYVGKTGVATGPHLHRESLVGRVHRNPSSELPDPSKGNIVTHKLFQNREKNRKIKPGQALYLVDKAGKKLDINPDVGLNETIVHVKVTGLTPGDTIWAVLEWNQKSTGKVSPHFPETAVADNEGDVVFNVPFVRAVTLGWFVHLKVVASPKNKKTGTVQWIDADVLHHG